VKGLMQNQPLLLSSLLQHADRFHGSTEIVSRTVEGPIHRYAYKDAARRTRKLADALRRWGVGPGDRVATLAGIIIGTSRSSMASPVLARCGMHQPAFDCGPDFLHYQSCRRQSAVFRERFSANGGEARTGTCCGRPLRSDGDRTAMPATSIPNIRCYEDFLDSGDENSSGRCSMNVGFLAVLYLGHDR